MQYADDDTGTGLAADQAARRLLPWSPRLCLGTTTAAAPKAKWLDSFAGRLHLAAEVMQHMQLQLDAEWRVQKLEHINTSKKEELQISHPRIPGRNFRSRAAVVAFLQSLQQDGQPLPGVLAPIPKEVMKHRHYGDPDAAATTAVTAAAGTTDQHLTVAGVRTRKRALGGDVAAAASSQPSGNDALAPGQPQHQQRRDRSQRLVAAAVQRAQARAVRPAAAAATATLTDTAGLMEGLQKQPKYRSVSAVLQTPEQQPGKRKRISPAAAAAVDRSGQPRNQTLPDGRQPCPIARETFQQQIAALVPGTVLDNDWVVYAASHAPPRADTCVMHPSFSDGYFRSTRAVAAYLQELKRKIKKLGPGVIVPGLLPQQQQQEGEAAAAPSAAAIKAAIQKSLVVAGRSYSRKGPAMLAALEAGSGRGSGNGGQAAAAAAARTPPSGGPLDLLAAAAAAAATGEQPKRKGNEKQLLPPVKKPRVPSGTQQQQQQRRQHGSSSNRPSSSAGSYTNAAAAAAADGSTMDTQLPDGRKPCAKTFAFVQSQLSTKLPGIALDHNWLIYAPQQEPPKMDTCIKHPGLPAGYFRSVRGVIQYLSALIPLIEKLGPCVAAPGVIHQTQPQRKPLLQSNGKPDRAVTLAMQQALKAAPGGFVWRGRGSSFKQKAATKLREKLLKQDAKQKDEQQGQQQQQQQQGSSGSGVSAAPAPAAAAAASVPKQKSSGAGAGYPGGGYSGSGYANTLGGQLDCLPGSLQRDIMIWRHPPIDREYEFPRKGAVLVLGMVFASAAAASQAHAGMAHHRDRVRLLQLKTGLGYKPHSFNRDDTDASAHQGLHVQGNFNSMRGAVEVANRFPGVKFRAIFCDYFRFPTGYASEVYKPQLFTQFVPELIRRGAADPGVPVYIPNNPVLLKQLAAAGAFTGYAEVVALPGECYPLYKATELAQEAGELVGGYSNATEARQLPEGSEFVVMRCFADAPVGGSTLPPKPK